jgi:hypothetical protein
MQKKEPIVSSIGSFSLAPMKQVLITAWAQLQQMRSIISIGEVARMLISSLPSVLI